MRHLIDQMARNRKHLFRLLVEAVLHLAQDEKLEEKCLLDASEPVKTVKIRGLELDH